MDHILYDYRPPNLATWIYLSSLLTMTIYFKFNRIWSLRNLDLVALTAFAPGLFLVERGGDTLRLGYVWLFVVGGLFMIRLLVDSMMVRRPLLEPNLSSGGLIFLGFALLMFLMVNVLTKDLTESDLAGPRRLQALLSRTEPPDQASLAEYGPGYPLLHMLPTIITKPLVEPTEATSEDARQAVVQSAVARTTAVLSHLAIVVGVILIGAWHFDNPRTGIAAATLYLLLPYTADMTGRVHHCLPGALLTLAVLAYRRPLVAGMLLGLVTGLVYYPVFLLPLWCSFYWQRGLGRFVSGFLITLALLVSTLIFTSYDLASFLTQAKQMLGWTTIAQSGITGFWKGEGLAPYRIPVFVAFVALSISFAIWPARKNLGTLMSCTAALMLGVQFWHAKDGGVYMAWYLPLLLLTVFRPNLDDRIALSVLGDNWIVRRFVHRADAA